MKKVRNNIIKSGNKKGCTRLLILQSGYEIHWKMWLDTYQWDTQNPIQIRQALTNEHRLPSNSNKKRNKLAEDVLNTEMLNLMIFYKENLVEKGECLNGAIKSKQKTSCLISNFRDRTPIHITDDNRLSQNRTVSILVPGGRTWSQNVQRVYVNHAPCLVSHHWFRTTIQVYNSRQTSWSLTPAVITSDPIENTFCQQRGKFNGLNKHYCSSISPKHKWGYIRPSGNFHWVKFSKSKIQRKVWMF